MKLAEFNALVVGDQVENAMTNGKGTVSKAIDPQSGRVVGVRWGSAFSAAGVEFSYPVYSTAWMHWSKVEPGCMCGHGAAGGKPCPGPDGKPACFVSDVPKGAT